MALDYEDRRDALESVRLLRHASNIQAAVKAGTEAEHSPLQAVAQLCDMGPPEVSTEKSVTTLSKSGQQGGCHARKRTGGDRTSGRGCNSLTRA
jgi:hypothetical protein